MLIGTYQPSANRALTLHEPSQKLLKELREKREREKEREGEGGGREVKKKMAKSYWSERKPRGMYCTGNKIKT